MTLKVLHVVEAIEGGVARYVTDLVAYTPRIDHSVVMPMKRSVGDTDHDAIARIAEVAQVHVVDMRRSPVALVNAFAVRAVRGLSEGADVVHGHSTIGGVIARLAARDKPVVYTPNALYPGAVAGLAERTLGRRTAAVVAVSPSEAEEIARRKLVPFDRLHVIHTGIARSTARATFNLRARIGAPAGAPVVGSAGRLVPQKDPLLFVAAMESVLRHLPDAHAVLLGEGPLRAEVDRRAAASDVAGRLHLLGHVPEARMLFPQLDVYVLASRYEGLPYSLLEAMQSAVATVASDAIGNRDVVRDEETGLLVPVGAADALAVAVERLLEDDELRGRLATAGQRLVATDFRIDTMAQAYVELYERLAARPSRQGR